MGKKRREPKRTRYAPDGTEVPLDDETAGATVVSRRRGPPIAQPGSGRWLLASETEWVEWYLRELERWGDKAYQENDGPGGPLSQGALGNEARISAKSALYALERVKSSAERGDALEALRAARHAVHSAIAAEHACRLADFKKHNEPEVLKARRKKRQERAAGAGGGKKKGARFAKRDEALRDAARILRERGQSHDSAVAELRKSKALWEGKEPPESARVKRIVAPVFRADSKP